MPTIQNILEFFDSQTPFALAEEWDNVGLLVGDPLREVTKVMSCLTITTEVIEEAISEQADLIVTHHPLPFQPLKKITSETTTGQLLLESIEAKIAIISPHTSFDSAKMGINEMLAKNIGMTDVQPICTIENNDPSVGKGRYGKLSTPMAIEHFVDVLKKCFDLQTVKTVCFADQKISKIAVACGSGGSFLSDAIAVGCDTFVTGEASFHTCLEARTQGITLILLGHFASERFALVELATRLGTFFPGIQSWASK